MKLALIVVGSLGLVIAGLTFAWRISPIGEAVREAHQKEVAFRSLTPTEFDSLIEIAVAFEKMTNGVSQGFGGYEEPEVPAEFARYGFDRVEVKAGIVECRVYWLVDSGGFARIETRRAPGEISFVKGDRGEIIDVVYMKKPKPNQALEPTTTAVTDRANARSAPAAVVAHL
jgi:hypothetical protein